LAVERDTSTTGLSEEFVQLFTRTQRRLYLFILSQVPNVQDAEEILQDANCVMLAKHHQFEPGSNFVAWASQIAVYEILKYRKRHGREKLRFSDEFLQAVAEEAPLTLDNVEERRRALELCLQKLRPKDRELIQERYSPGTRGRDLAEDLGRPANSLYQSLGRIRRTLMECVERQLAALEAN
jgi:RNA polymerase sigma-70 factor (ECF subfamily)